ncbi:GNAT family N-acetyltransferase [Exilibacterium tricleocarpae]|uniref:GNAT family N-acetyltransferase n=1 Tax=Exilibacterium tricleocarpae TaxID=2591008 RepID=A0A545SXG9_9GAMM|nr:N-acetyltransferase [Exilibacterium tricleocarpae]TQV69656.1 GNAT family N-acetyltransferase [Exilibacterium tricleocarpae]
MKYINLTTDTIDAEHICCAFSDKKCAAGYEAKKQWLAKEFNNEYVFRRLDERAKVFIEYGPAEKAWTPVAAANYMMLGCFWVSGKYKQKGHGKALLKSAVDDAKKQGKDGLVAVVGTKKFHFMSDTKWLLRQGFEVCEELSSGFSLLSLDFNDDAVRPAFKRSVKKPKLPLTKGCVVYFSNRCPYTEHYVDEHLTESCKRRKLPLQIVKIKTIRQAQSAPTPATIFSLFLDGEFATTDISACMDNRFDKVVGKR